MTRGKNRWVARSSGGAVRDIDAAQIERAFADCYELSSVSPELVSAVQDLLSVREVSVSNPNAVFRQKDLERLRTKARALSDCLRELPDLKGLSSEIMFYDLNRVRDSKDFMFWLVALQQPETFLINVSIAASFRSTIGRLADLCEGTGLDVSTTPNGKFGRLLTVLDELYPGLIFPKDTVQTNARRDYIREGLRARLGE